MAEVNCAIKSAPRAFLTISEAASTLGCTRRFLETRIEDGEIKVFRPSKRMVRIRATEFERFVEAYSFGGTSAN
jgi:excisionase family DNA binding protein